MRDRQAIQFSGESIASWQEGEWAGGTVSPPAKAPTCRQQEVSRRQAATWIRVLLRLQPDLPVAWLAQQLGLSDRLIGLGLALLIRQGKARIRRGAGGLRVLRVEAEPPGATEGSRARDATL